MSGPGEIKTILIIEDEAELRKVFRQILQFEGFTVLEAGDGRAGLEAARAHIPDLILCDVLMPEMNGYQTSEALRKDPRTAQIPIIITSALAHTEAIVEGLLFADEYVTKPINLIELKARIHSILRLKQARDALSELNENLTLRVRDGTNRLRTKNRRLVREVRRRRKSEQEVEELSGRLIQIREEEYSTLAREIHDDVGQSLFALKLLCQTLFATEELLPSGKKEIIARLGEVVEKVRGLSRSISPVGYPGLGMETAITKLAASMQSPAGPKFQVDLSGLDMALPDGWDINVYRIAQEALSNVVRHSRARMVRVYAQSLPSGGALLCICDDGIGFDPAGPREGIGLKIMEKRCTLFHGRMRIRSTIGEGTELQIEIPGKISNHPDR